MKRFLLSVFALLTLMSGVAIGLGADSEVEAAPWHKTINVTGSAWCGPKFGATYKCASVTLNINDRQYYQTIGTNGIFATYTFTGVPKNGAGWLKIKTGTWECSKWVTTGDPWTGTTNLGSYTCRK